jgi:hypothetical protein
LGGFAFLVESPVPSRGPSPPFPRRSDHGEEHNPAHPRAHEASDPAKSRHITTTTTNNNYNDINKSSTLPELGETNRLNEKAPESWPQRGDDALSGSASAGSSREWRDETMRPAPSGLRKRSFSTSS